MKNKKLLLIALCICLVITLILFGLIFYFVNRKTFVLSLPKLEEIESISLKTDNNTSDITTVTEISNILHSIMGIRFTHNNSIQDFPVNATGVVTINFKCNDKTFSVYAYNRKNKYYIEQPYNGIYEISKKDYDYLYNYLIDDDITIKNFYTDEIITKYKIITDLDVDYSIEDAMKDGCFVVNHARVYNENLYSEFMQNYNDKKFAFIRLVKPTVEGDIFILDIKYDNELDKIVVLCDNTRDEFSAQEDRIISIRDYDKIGSYRHDGNLYWVAYNGELNEQTFDSNDVLVLTVIN